MTEQEFNVRLRKALIDAVSKLGITRVELAALIRKKFNLSYKDVTDRQFKGILGAEVVPTALQMAWVYKYFLDQGIDIPLADPRSLPPRYFKNVPHERKWTESQWQAFLKGKKVPDEKVKSDSSVNPKTQSSQEIYDGSNQTSPTPTGQSMPDMLNAVLDGYVDRFAAQIAQQLSPVIGESIAAELQKRLGDAMDSSLQQVTRGNFSPPSTIKELVSTLTKELDDIVRNRHDAIPELIRTCGDLFQQLLQLMDILTRNDWKDAIAMYEEFGGQL